MWAKFMHVTVEITVFSGLSGDISHFPISISPELTRLIRLITTTEISY